MPLPSLRARKYVMKRRARAVGSPMSPVFDGNVRFTRFLSSTRECRDHCRDRQGCKRLTKACQLAAGRVLGVEQPARLRKAPLGPLTTIRRSSPSSRRGAPNMGRTRLNNARLIYRTNGPLISSFSSFPSRPTSRERRTRNFVRPCAAERTGASYKLTPTEITSEHSERRGSQAGQFDENFACITFHSLPRAEISRRCARPRACVYAR